MTNKSEREELFMTLSSKLDKEDAEELEIHIVKFINKKLDTITNTILDNIGNKNIVNSYLRKETVLDEIDVDFLRIGNRMGITAAAEIISTAKL